MEAEEIFERFAERFDGRCYKKMKEKSIMKYGLKKMKKELGKKCYGMTIMAKFLKNVSMKYGLKSMKNVSEKNAIE